MYYAINEHGKRVDASEFKENNNKSATCPVCGGQVIPKMGELKQWHFAHKKKECDARWEPMTVWHREWQERFLPKYREIVHTDANTGEKHIADVKLKNKLVIEFQHSPISLQEMKARETFYQKMCWVVDASKFLDNLNLIASLYGGFYFIWNYPKINWLISNVPVFFDFGEIGKKMFGARLLRLEACEPPNNASAKIIFLYPCKTETNLYIYKGAAEKVTEWPGGLNMIGSNVDAAVTMFNHCKKLKSKGWRFYSEVEQFLFLIPFWNGQSSRIAAMYHFSHGLHLYQDAYEKSLVRRKTQGIKLVLLLNKNKGNPFCDIRNSEMRKEFLALLNKHRFLRKHIDFVLDGASRSSVSFTRFSQFLKDLKLGV